MRRSSSARIKADLFAKIENIVAPDSILASNTSSLPISRLASTLKHPERFVGMHFFNPAPVMKLVEVAACAVSAPDAVRTANAWAIGAEQALGLGLIGSVMDDGGALDAALAMATRIAARAPLAMRQAKLSIGSALDLPHSAHLAMERHAFSALFGSADKHEGVEAFLAKGKGSGRADSANHLLTDWTVNYTRVQW